MGIITRKQQTLINILSSYESYKGSYLNKLKEKLTHRQFDINGLIVEFENYKNYLLTVIASTTKVFVKLDKEFNFTAEEYNKVFDDID